MKVVITGAAGMVGSALVRTLEAGHEVVGLGREDVDLLDAVAVRSLLSEFAPDVVLHAAGRVGGIAANARANSDFLVDNARMGFNVVEGAHESGVTRLLNLSSSCIYPRDRERLREDDVLTGPLEPTNQGYALAKISVMYLCQALSAEHAEISYKTFIPCNLFGPGDRYDEDRAHLVPSAIRKVDLALQKGEDRVSVWGDGTARREFMFVGDLAAAVAQALDGWDSTPDVLNIGLGTDHSVTDYYRAVAGVLGFDGDLVYEPDRPVGMRCKLLDVSRAREWGWSAATTLENGLRIAIDDYLSRR